MLIHNIYLGTWFPRTSIHLKELFHFLKEKKVTVGLDRKKANIFHDSLGLKSCVYHEEHVCDYIEAIFDGVSFIATEDGVMLARNIEPFIFSDNKIVAEKKELLRDFYVSKMGPIINYLFSLGAPVPRDFSKFESILPFILVVSDAQEDNISKLYADTSENKTSVVYGTDINVHNSPSLVVIVINNKELIQKNLIQIEDFVKQYAFFRDVELQLEEYLLKHREYWNEISRVRNSKVLRFKDFSVIRQRLLNMRRDITGIDARLLQMGDILVERSRAVSPEDKKLLRQIGLYRFESINSSLQYMKHLWEMTFQYLDGTMDLLHIFYEENTQREFSVLKTITFAGAIAGFFGMNVGFPWEDRWPIAKDYSIIVAAIVIFGPILFYIIFKRLLLNRRFNVNNKDIKVKS